MTVIVCEKPSVAREYAKYLGLSDKQQGYIQGDSPVTGRTIVTWTVGHLVTLSYPETYDEAMKKWTQETLPFLPPEYKYEVIPSVKDQYAIVKSIYKSLGQTDRLFYAGDSGREGIYIQMLVRQKIGIPAGVEERVVWIDSQTQEEILRGIRDAKPVSAYQGLIDAAYMRAIEDYAIGINFSRMLSIKYGARYNEDLQTAKYKPLSVGRVMTCVLGMIVEKEREIRAFTETPFYRIVASVDGSAEFDWRARKGSRFFESPALYSENGFRKKEDAQALTGEFAASPNLTVVEAKKTQEKKYAPLLFNLAEAQFQLSKKYKITPAKVLEVIQGLYDKKLVTYPRTDARVLTTAIAKEIGKNLAGLAASSQVAKQIYDSKRWLGLEKSHYVDDSKVTDHYAIIPTGLRPGDLSELEEHIYGDIVTRFLSIFMPPAVYDKAEVVLEHGNKERFYGSKKTIVKGQEGFLALTKEYEEGEGDENLLLGMNVGDVLTPAYDIREGKTVPPKRYTSGGMVLAMENAGKLIEDEELRAQIKSSGIGTSATRAEIIQKLIKNEYISLNAKTQILTPAPAGELLYDIVKETIPTMLSPSYTASWERGLAGIENGQVTRSAYQEKLNGYVRQVVEDVKGRNASDVKSEVKGEGLGELTCPICKKGKVLPGKKQYFCSRWQEGCGFRILKEYCGAGVSAGNAAKMVQTGKSNLIKGMTSKAGKKFDAYLVLKPDGTVEFQFPERKGTGKSGKSGKGGKSKR